MRKGEQPPWMVPDGLWERIEPLLPRHPRRLRDPGRKRVPDRQVLVLAELRAADKLDWSKAVIDGSHVRA